MYVSGFFDILSFIFTSGMEDLLLKYRATNDLNYLVELYQPYQQKVFRMCMHYLKHAHDSEDAVVDIFIELKDKLLKYDVDNFPAWLHTLVRNHCLKKLRKKGRILLTEDFFSAGLVESEWEEDQIDRWLERLPDAIESLDDKQRWCIVLFYLHGKSYREIEAECNFSSMEVKSAIQNGKIKLKKILESR